MDYYIRELQARLETMPAGYISHKIIQGKERCYYQWREGGKIRSRYLKDGEQEELESLLKEKKELQEELRHVRSLDRRLKAYADRFYLSRTVPIGEQDYEALISGRNFYVDKTKLIEEWWESGDSVTLITRPRRFGKTLNLSMLKCFFSTQYADRGDLFEGLYIWSKPGYRRLQGTWPVISLSFSSVKYMPHMAENFRNIIVGAFWDHDYLASSDRLTPAEREAYLSVNRHMAPAESADALQLLCRLLYRHWGHRAIVLLDEYDTPLQEAYAAGCLPDAIDFFRGFFNFTFKNNPWLHRALITGITRISKESLFSDLNNLRVISALSRQYETAFGFTEPEVFAALEEQGIGTEEMKAAVKSWYDGFRFGDVSDIYNPWSIICFLREREFRPYWSNTSSHRLMSLLLARGSQEVKDTLLRLIRGEAAEVPYEEELVLQQLDTEESALWSLLVASGYLRADSVISPASSGENTRLLVSVTNRETIGAFRQVIRLWFSDRNNSCNRFVRSLLANDLDAMNDYMGELLRNTVSCFDVPGGDSEPRILERFYHGFVLGLIVDLEQDYEIRSNRESGYGRYDIMLIPRSREADAYIMEFKTFRPGREHSLEETATSALNQIRDRQYETELLDRGMEKSRIRCYGFGFRGKEVLILSVSQP